MSECIRTMVQFHMLQLYFSISQGCTFTLIPNSMGSYHGQILIEKETDSYDVALQKKSFRD